jgi:hypothetical protein
MGYWKGSLTMRQHRLRPVHRALVLALPKANRRNQSTPIKRMCHPRIPMSNTTNPTSPITNSSHTKSSAPLMADFNSAKSTDASRKGIHTSSLESQGGKTVSDTI